MSEEKKDGGPAFPMIGNNDSAAAALQQGRSGMSLRDYFAAKAMQGFVSALPPGDSSTPLETLSAWSYQAADEMLKTREQ